MLSPRVQLINYLLTLKCMILVDMPVINRIHPTPSDAYQYSTRNALECAECTSLEDQPFMKIEVKR